MSGGALRTLIVDSDPESRATLRNILGAFPAIMVAGEAETLRDGMAMLAAIQPDVLILETAGDVTAVADIARRHPSTAILASGHGTSADAVIEIIRAGAFEFLRRPVGRQDLTGALEKLARFKGANGTARGRGRVTAVFSPKGGLGATTLAVNIAVCLAGKGQRRAVLAELDASPSDVTTFLDLAPRYSVLDALESVDRMDDALLQALLLKHESGLQVLPGPSRGERMTLAAEHVRLGVELLASRFDHVVLDLPHEVDPATAAALEAADSILYVTALDVAAMRQGATGLKVLREVGIDTHKVKVVVMRDGTGHDVTLKHVREALGLPVYWRVPNDYRAAVAAINEGRPVVTAASRSRVAQSLRECAAALVGEARGTDRVPERRRATLGAGWPMKRFLGA